jgi:serine/threonine-protein kinase
MTQVSHPPIPRRIGRYEILLPIASGGMGAVYLAKSRGVRGFERLVAVKVMHAHLRDEKDFAQDLVEEAKLAGRIQHPNVVSVLDVGDDPFGVFLVMDYVEGDTLAGLLRARRVDGDAVIIPPRIGLKILVDSLHGLHAAHELQDETGQPLGLVHRDFSPQNILIGVDGVSRLTDFGVAKASSRLTHTRTGLVKGKVHYMSPEQAKSEPLDRRSDVWAAGVIAWEILSGKRLYRDRGETAVLLQLVSALPPRLRRVSPDLPRVLEEAVARALSLGVEGRWSTAKQLSEALVRGADVMGGLASVEEVGAYVKEVAAEGLERRRQQLRGVMKLHEELASIEQQASEDNRRRAELPTPPMGHVAVEADGMPRASQSEAITQTVGEPMNEVTGTPQAIDVRERRAQRPWRSYALALLAVALLGGVLVYRQVEGGSSALLSDGMPQAPVLPPVPEPSASSAAPLEIELIADAEVRELWVGERRVILSPPSKSFQLKLAEGEREATLTAVSLDGRRAEVSIDPGTSRIEVSFPARAPIRPVPKKRTAPLASSPYER